MSTVDAFRLTVSERHARGRAARSEAPRSAHADWGPHPDRPRAGRAARGAGADAGPRARADPQWAHGLVGVRVLPRRRLRHGQRPRRDAAHRPERAGLRRRPPVELRRLRRARPPPRLRHQRLRRDAARAVGVGRQAPGRQPGDRGARAGDEPQGARADRARERRRLPPGHERLRGYEQSRRLLRAHGPRADRRARGPDRARGHGRAARAQHPEGAQEEQPARAAQAHEGGGRPPPLRQRAAAAGAGARARARRRGRRSHAGHPRAHRPLRGDAARRDTPAARAATSSSTLPARSSASAAWAPGPGWSFSSAATTGTRCSCRSRRRRPRCSSGSCPRASSRTTASGWSRASG